MWHSLISIMCWSLASTLVMAIIGIFIFFMFYEGKPQKIDKVIELKYEDNDKLELAINCVKMHYKFLLRRKCYDDNFVEILQRIKIEDRDATIEERKEIETKRTMQEKCRNCAMYHYVYEHRGNIFGYCLLDEKYLKNGFNYKENWQQAKMKYYKEDIREYQSRFGESCCENYLKNENKKTVRCTCGKEISFLKDYEKVDY